MTTEQAYIKWSIKIDNNFQNSKVSGDRGRFVLIFNESQNKMVENILDSKDDEIRYIQKLNVSDRKIPRHTQSETADYFKLPENYFEFSSTYSKASKGKCLNKNMELFEIKDANKDVIMNDEFSQPSFESREAPFSILSDKVKVYKKDFNNTELYLSYYRYPVQIRLLNEDDPEGEFDEEYAPEFDDKFVDRIISMASGEFETNTGDAKFQIDKQRAIQKI